MHNHTTQICTSKIEWESHLDSFPEANFLQSWNWGDFQERMGKKVFRMVIFDNKVGDSMTENLDIQLKQPIIAMMQIILEPARRGSYLAIPGGPLLNWQNGENLQIALAELKRLAQAHNCWFIRIRPQEIYTETSAQHLQSNGCILAPMHLTADLTLQLDLTKDEDSLLSEMRKNTRGSIKKAFRDGVTTTVSTDINDLITFCKLQKELADAHGFIPFSDAFLKTQFEVFLSENQVALVHAWHGNELLATSFILFYRGEAVYHYGVSSAANREYPGSVASQWRAIQEAKMRGCITYNFWGIAPKDELEHRFAGVSLFKRGFGGEEVSYIPAHDLPVSKMYWITYYFEKFRAKIRKLS
ncbi:MAG: peptidoglycan bridge formation glycyltransferase FemA/FemB family protein [Microgenomates group bacterium]